MIWNIDIHYLRLYILTVFINLIGKVHILSYFIEASIVIILGNNIMLLKVRSIKIDAYNYC